MYVINIDMYKNITNPNTGKIVPLNSKKGKKILAESVVFKVLMKAIGHQTEHKKAIEEYNKEDTLSQKIERGIRRRLRSSGLNEPTKLAKKIMKTSVIMGNNVNDNINNFINKNKKDNDQYD